MTEPDDTPEADQPPGHAAPHAEPLPVLPALPADNAGQVPPPPGEPSPGEPPPHRPPPHRPPPPRRPPLRPETLAWGGALGFLILAAAIGAVAWYDAQRPAADSTALQDLQALQDRVARLEQRPALSADQINTLNALPGHVAALEQQAKPDLGPLESRLAALEREVGSSGQNAARLDALASRVDALAGRDQNTVSDLSHRLDSDETRLASLEQTVSGMASRATQAERLAHIELAQVALAAGQPLGNLPGAPAAVAHFATTAPPTEAALRLAFPAAAQAALDASAPDTGGKPFLGRMMARAEGLVTVRRGDTVLVGNPAAGVLQHAQAALDAGDLSGAVAAVSKLSGPSAAAMADWLAEAKALLAARSGLADMAAHS